ncbi:unnamed protein product [Coregonus sp. 'balchen']|nr:unnamed protein product [Coregonus sp. 'balchen']
MPVESESSSSSVVGLRSRSNISSAHYKIFRAPERNGYVKTLQFFDPRTELSSISGVGSCARRDATDEQQLFFLSAPGAAVVLACLATGALMVARLKHGISVIVFVSVVRTISLISLHKAGATWRPYVAYLVGVLGILLARCDLLLDAMTDAYPSLATSSTASV